MDETVLIADLASEDSERVMRSMLEEKINSERIREIGNVSLLRCS